MFNPQTLGSHGANGNFIHLLVPQRLKLTIYPSACGTSATGADASNA